MRVAVIPARGGSKRIPQKNINPFCGQPIIAYSIKEALASQLFDKVIVSTDCPAIAEVAETFGAQVPFIRPADISGDITGTREVVQHTINWLNEHFGLVDYICCIYATAPFIQAAALSSAFAQLEKNDDKHCIFSVTEYSYSPFRSFDIENNYPKLLYPEHMKSRSQDLTQLYHDAGQFYWTKLTRTQQVQPMINSKDALVHVLPNYRVQDIDTPDDWRRAEAMYLALQTLESDD